MTGTTVHAVPTLGGWPGSIRARPKLVKLHQNSISDMEIPWKIDLMIFQHLIAEKHGFSNTISLKHMDLEHPIAKKLARYLKITEKLALYSAFQR